MIIDKTEKEIMVNWSETLDNPVVSIASVTFNHELFIEEALNSFLSQETSFPFEIVIYDDASSDGTPMILEEYAKKFPNIVKPIYQKNNQYSTGRINTICFVLPQTKGKYIAICDGDDFWSGTTKLEKQVAFLENNEKYSMVYHNSAVVNEKSHVSVEKRSLSPKDYSEEEMLLGESFILTNTMMFRTFSREEWEDYAFKYQKIRNGDMALVHKLGSIGKCKYMDEIDYAAYRLHSAGVWSGIDELVKLIHIHESKRIIEKNLTDYPKVQAKMNDVISRHCAVSLSRILLAKGFTQYKKVINIIIDDKQLSLPSIFIQHIYYTFSRALSRLWQS